MFFFCRVGVSTNATTGAVRRTEGGRPIFQWCADQYQHAYNRFTVAWTQPGVYYIGMSGAVLAIGTPGCSSGAHGIFTTVNPHDGNSLGQDSILGGIARAGPGHGTATPSTR